MEGSSKKIWERKDGPLVQPTSRTTESSPWIPSRSDSVCGEHIHLQDSNIRAGLAKVSVQSQEVEFY